MEYEVLGNIHHDGAAYGPGARIEKITGDQAAVLIASGLLRPAESGEPAGSQAAGMPADSQAAGMPVKAAKKKAAG